MRLFVMLQSRLKRLLDGWDCNVWSFHSEDGTAP